MDGGAGDSITLRQLAQALTLAAIAQDPDAIKVEWFAANVPALELGATHAGAHPFDNEAAFQLRNASDDDSRSPDRADRLYRTFDGYGLHCHLPGSPAPYD